MPPGVSSATNLREAYFLQTKVANISEKTNDFLGRLSELNQSDRGILMRNKTQIEDLIQGFFEGNKKNSAQSPEANAKGLAGLLMDSDSYWCLRREDLSQKLQTAFGEIEPEALGVLRQILKTGFTESQEKSASKLHILSEYLQGSEIQEVDQENSVSCCFAPKAIYKLFYPEITKSPINEVFDLSDLSPGAIWARLKIGKKFPEVQSLLLPKHIQDLPVDLLQRAFPRLIQLKLPQYAGPSLDLRKLTKLESVQVDGQALKEIHVLNRAEVRYSGSPRIDEGIAKIKVFSYDPSQSKEYETKTVSGQPYFSANNDEVPTTDLNFQVEFGNGVPIACRHLALSLPPKEPKTHFVDSVAKRLGSEELIKNNIPPSRETVWEKVSGQSLDNHLVHRSQMGRFVREQLEGMTGALTEKHFLLLSGSHAMELTLKRKEKEGKTEYVATLYDPNRTLTHARIAETNLDEIEKNLSLGTFLTDESIEHYFGNEQVMCLITLPHDLSEATVLADEWPGKGERSVKTYLPADAHGPLYDGMGYHLLVYGLPLEPMFGALKECKTPEERMNLLSAKTTDGMPGLYAALENGNAETVTAYIHGLQELIKEGGLKPEHAMELLHAKTTNGFPGLYTALFKGHAETVTAYIHGLLELIKEGGLKPEHAMELLHAKTTNGTPGLCLALNKGHAETVTAYIHGLLELIKERGLKPEHAMELLHAKTTNGFPGLYTALNKGNAETVTAYIHGLLELIKKGFLKPEHAMELLHAKTTADLPGLYAALYKGHAETVTAYIHGLQELIKEGGLKPEHAVELLHAKTTNGFPGLHAALENGKMEAVKAFTEGVRELVVERLLTQKQASQLLDRGNSSP